MRGSLAVLKLPAATQEGETMTVFHHDIPDDGLIETHSALAEIEGERAARTEFDVDFKRTRWGALWRKYEGLLLMVYPCGIEAWAWSIADENGVRKSPKTYSLEGFARESLAAELGFFTWVPREAWE
jgi:hypothetical protein